MRLGGRHQQGVKLVEEGGIGRQVRLEERPRLLVPGGARQQAVAHEDAARIGVGHEQRPAGGV
ncbi:MAG TPA: hypothetical protein VGD07_02400, partial [Methylomirabilota bacterium]